MSFNAEIKTLGFKDMHEEQVEAFLRMIDLSLSLAEAYDNAEVFDHALQVAEDAVILFGGNGIEVKFEAAY